MKRYLIFAATLLVVLATYSIVGLQVVPSAEGTYAQARESLEDAGFRVLASDISGDQRQPHDLAIVVGQTPPAGSIRSLGSVVTVETRSPQEDVTVPDVTGMELQQAEQALEAAGLAPEADEPAPLDATVESTIPAAGTQVRFGSTVFCRLGR